MIFIILLAASFAHAEKLATTTEASAPRAITRDDLLADEKFKRCLYPPPKPVKPADCSPQAPASPDYFKPVKPNELPDTLIEGNLENLKSALEKQLKHCEGLKDSDITLGGKKFKRKDLCLKSNQGLQKIATTPGIDFATFLNRAKSELDWYQYTCEDKSGNVGFTGYYSPVIKIKAKKPGEDCKYPLYGRPKDLVEVEEEMIECKGQPTERVKRTTVTKRKLPDGKLVPYYTREEINSKNVLRGKNLELVCLDSAWAVHDLQIQGSGILEEVDDSGRTVKKHYINFDSRNGHTWKGVGSAIKCLRETGRYEAKDLTMKGIGEWLAKHPEVAEAVMNLDPSYVFFEDKASAPLGVDHLELTPGHSLAVDKSLIPIGTPILYSTTLPGKVPSQSLALAQDVGGAIKGCRIDIYFGEGDEAGRKGGSMKNNGKLFIAIPKS